jgi:hypothetical protein
MKFKCPVCNGSDKESYYKKNEKNERILVFPQCFFCNNKKDLDWVENILGVEYRPIEDFFKNWKQSVLGEW